MTVGGGQAGSGTEIVQGGLPPLQLVDQVWTANRQEWNGNSDKLEKSFACVQR